MKFLIAFIFFSLSLIQIKTYQDSHLNGRYKIIFKNQCFTTYNCINFKDKNCEFLIDRFPLYFSTINYGQTTLTINSPQPNIIFQFKTSEISKDTIPFTIHNTNSEYMNYLHISIGSGELIKL